MGKINSKAKGKENELKACRLLKEHGIEARRSQQFCGRTPEASAILTPGYPQLYWEIKAVESLSVQKTMERAREDCAEKNPVLVWFKNRKKPLVVIEFDHFVELLKNSG